MSMQNDWVERIFTRMLARYGSLWINAWAGVDAQAMIEDWGRVLDGLPAHMISYGLENLPDRPPIATQFRAICIQRPARHVLALVSPPADPERVAAAIGAMMGAKPAGHDPKAWAYRLKEREMRHGGELESGKQMTKAQRDMWRDGVKAGGA